MAGLIRNSRPAENRSVGRGRSRVYFEMIIRKTCAVLLTRRLLPTVHLRSFDYPFRNNDAVESVRNRRDFNGCDHGGS